MHRSKEVHIPFKIQNYVPKNSKVEGRKSRKRHKSSGEEISINTSKEGIVASNKQSITTIKSILCKKKNTIEKSIFLKEFKKVKVHTFDGKLRSVKKLKNGF